MQTITLDTAQQLPPLTWWQRLALRMRQAILKRAAGDEPLIYTVRGMEPASGLERAVQWNVTPGVEATFVECWRDRSTGEIVKRSVDVLKLQPLPPIGTEQAAF